MESLTFASLLQNAALIRSELRGFSPTSSVRLVVSEKLPPKKQHPLGLGGLERCVVVTSNQSEVSPAAQG